MKLRLSFFILTAIVVQSCTSSGTEFHVSPTGNDSNIGTKKDPLKSITAAAKLAQAGDVITVHEGIYRERINPPRGGESDAKRITYQAAKGETVFIKGSEVIKGWEKVSGDTWKVTIPTKLLKKYNPYRDLVYGDWFSSKGRQFHTGAVYLNGHWLNEAAKLNDVLSPADTTPLWFCNDVQRQHQLSGNSFLLNVSTLGINNKTISAADFQSQVGIGIAPSTDGGKCIGWIEQGDRVFYDKVDLGKQTSEMSFRVASDTEGGVIEVHLGSQDGKVLGRCTVKGTGGWQKWTIVKTEIIPTSGIQTICLVFKAHEIEKKQIPVPKETIIWAQFKGVDPNKELVEINVRPMVFYSDKPGRNYITVRGFIMEQAATQWAAPTAEQVGLIGTHWSKGWIIENNVIRYSNCVGVTLGKERSTGHNLATHDKSKDGTAHYHDVINSALKIGWSKENIGSHLIRNNHISHCEQAGIVGSLGGVFSTIVGNTIHEINMRGIYFGAEMAGIKLHAPIDVLIKNNHIYRCQKGIWLDWMTQGTRVTGNLFHDNQWTDMFIEVNHGPYLVDNNVFLTKICIVDWSQGGAFSHNIFAGDFLRRPEMGRSTPYHKPHSTEVAGYSKIPSGDDRFYNNLFVGGNGIAGYKAAKLPVVADGNVYMNEVKPYPGEKNNLNQGNNATARLIQKDGGFYLQMTLPEDLGNLNTQLVTTDMLGVTIIAKARYENMNGKSLKIDTDFFGKTRNTNNPLPGPFTNVQGILELKLR